MDTQQNNRRISDGGDSVKAAFVASFIRTGHLDSPVWRVIRYTLHKWLWGSATLQQAIDLLAGQGYNRLMAYDIANEFSKQCRARNSFASYADDDNIYELPITQSAIPSRYSEPLPMLQTDEFGDRVATAACTDETGLHAGTLQERSVQDVCRDPEHPGISTEGGITMNEIEIKQQIALYTFRLEYGLRLADYYRLVRDTAKREMIAAHRQLNLKDLAYWQGYLADWSQS